MSASGSPHVAFEVPVEAAAAAGMLRNERLRLGVCFVGVFVCYFYYGILQESITRGQYGSGDVEERFRFAMSLVFVQCVISALFAKLVMTYVTRPAPDRTAGWLSAACAVSYLGAMVSSNSALQYVNYPTQVLGKSCKPIPVMILGVLLARKRYPLIKYLCVLLIVVGVAMFLYKGKGGAKGGDGGGPEQGYLGYGEILLLVSLTLDGLTGVTQDKMKSRHQTGSHHMMFNVNLWSSLLLGVGVLVTGEIFEFVSFTERHPAILYKILLFSITSALGQNFIFMTVVSFGPLTCSIITTTRKFFTILASVLLFSNPMSSFQWVGTVLVFMGLGMDSLYGKVPKKA
uniref:Solute carrier family 35 member B1 n=1 Tax=Petromyzon marinus TaxID=7757 RepID=A0AAJ7XFK3_PETMA|nr:solute carrier family 35 member B1 [Petromyzon marinus]